MIGDPGHMHKERWADRALVAALYRVVVRQTAQPVMRTTEESRPAMKGFETNTALALLTCLLPQRNPAPL